MIRESFLPQFVSLQFYFKASLFILSEWILQIRKPYWIWSKFILLTIILQSAVTEQLRHWNSMDSSAFMLFFSSFTHRQMQIHNRHNLNIFNSFFGVSPLVCSEIWILLNKQYVPYMKPVHLFWASLFLKQYNTENVSSMICKCDEKTFRKWVWLIINELKLPQKVWFLIR